MTYRIVADSSSNVYELKGTDYRFVSLTINCEDKEYVDTPTVDVNKMIEDLKASSAPTHTSCPNMMDWLNAFEGADCIFAFAITGNLSGSYSAAVRAREEYLQQHPECKVYLLDTLSTGPEMRLLVERTAQLIADGKSFDEISAALTKYHQHTHLLFCLCSLDNLVKNGRVSQAKAILAGVLGLRIVGKASAVGTLEELRKCRGEKRSIDGIYDEMKKHGYHGGKVRIAHCQNAPAAEKLSDKIRTDFPAADIQLEACGALCSFYAEEGGLLIGYED